MEELYNSLGYHNENTTEILCLKHKLNFMYNKENILQVELIFRLIQRNGIRMIIIKIIMVIEINLTIFNIFYSTVLRQALKERSER